MELFNLFDSKSKQLFWRAMPASHLSGVPAPVVINPGSAYFVIRLCEMYLATARKLWHQIYPMVHCYTSSGAVQTHAIASPAELRELGDANLERLTNLNVKLAGPVPYTGEEVSILTGLYAIPGHDAAKALIDVVGSFASLDPVHIGRAVLLSNLIKNAVESILGLDQATLQLGVRDSFSPETHPLTSGYFVGIGAAEQTVDASQLWISGGRLFKGKDLATAAPYSDHDYMVLAIERIEAREDWQQLGEIQDFHKRFTTMIGDPGFTANEKRVRFAGMWPAFVQALADSPNLTDPDRERIAALVAADLLKKLRLQEEANPFLRAA